MLLDILNNMSFGVYLSHESPVANLFRVEQILSHKKDNVLLLGTCLDRVVVDRI